MGVGGAEIPQGADPPGRHAVGSQGELVHEGEAVQGESRSSGETDNDRRKLFATEAAAAFLFDARFGAILKCPPASPSVSPPHLSFNLSPSFYQSAEQTGAGNEGAGRATGQGYQGFQVHGVLRHDAGWTQR